MMMLMALAVLAQDPDRRQDELRRDMERRLKEMDEKHRAERARIQEEFERRLRDPKDAPPPKEQRGRSPEGPEGLLRGILERVERTLGDVERRLHDLERRFGDRREPPQPPAPPRVERPGDPGRLWKFNFDWKDGQKWMEQGRQFFQGDPGVRRAVEELKKMVEEHKGEGMERMKDAVERLRRMLEDKRF